MRRKSIFDEKRDGRLLSVDTRRLPTILLLILLSMALALEATAGGQGKASEVYPNTPKGVVEAFCIEDFKGSGTTSQTWKRLQQYTTWLDAPGWDTVIVVSSFRVVEAKQSSGKAQVKVDYNVIGELVAHPWALNEQLGFKTVVYELVKADGRWKIADPQIPPHISVQSAIRDLQKYIGYYEKNKDLLNNERERIRLESARETVKSLSNRQNKTNLK
jgi:hypothetical protein